MEPTVLDRLNRPAPPGQPGQAATGAQPAPGAARGPMRSDELLQGRKTVEISHNGAVYRLQATRLGKLILTK